MQWSTTGATKGKIGGLDYSSHEHTVRGGSVGVKMGMSVGFHFRAHPAAPTSFDLAQRSF